MKSNISVGPPINLATYAADSFNVKHLRLRIGDPYLAKIRKLWETSLRQAFDQMPDIEWGHDLTDSKEDIFTD